MIGLWVSTPVGPIRTSTLLGAVLVFGIVTAVRRDPLRGLVAVVAWTALFETLYQVVGIVGFHWPTANFAWETAALAGWIILAGVLGIWPDWRLLMVFVVLMGFWITAGFHSNVAGQAAPLNLRDEVLNESSKTALALAYLAGALKSRSARPDERTGSVGRSARYLLRAQGLLSRFRPESWGRVHSARRSTR